MDEANIAQAQIERDEALMLRRIRRARWPEATGQCLWCGALLLDEQRWCDADCRDDWERDHARR